MDLTLEEKEIIRQHRAQKHQEEEQRIKAMVKMNGLTWHDVLDCKKYYGHFDYCVDAVVQVGYRYFVFNHLVYALTEDTNHCFILGTITEVIRS